jgi:hypothetical protein
MADTLPRRDQELAKRTDGKLYRKLIETFARVWQGFNDQARRSDNILDYWDIYNCINNYHQFYNGNSNIYVPIVYSAIEARKTRFINQIFPQSGRYIDATSTDGGVPHAMVALLENYIRRAKMKTEIMTALLRNGDVEGHYHLFSDWNRYERHVISRETRKPEIDLTGIAGSADDAEDIIDVIPEVLIDEGPNFDVLFDADVLVQPVTAKSIEDALHQGGQVTIIRRWTKETLEHLIDTGEVMSGPANELIKMSVADGIPWKNPEKQAIDAAGIKGKGGPYQVYEMYKVLETDEGSRLCSALYGGHDLILSAKRIKNWNDRCPLLSCPQAKVAGSFKGVSAISKGIDTLQYHACQVAQQAADSATFSMLPIIMSDPAKNPRTSTMILNLAAIWECDPNSTKFAEFPKLWQDGIALIQADTQAIFQAFGVNPAMLPQQTGRPGAKRNQAEVALEQTVDLLTTAEACSVLEEGILTPGLEQMVDLDHQYRDNATTVRAYGELGHLATMETVPPQQTRNRFNFTWFGVEQARNAAQMQQQIAALNVGKQFSADLQKAGYLYNPAPAIEHAFGNIFGWRMGRQILIDTRSQLTIDPEMENQMLEQGFAVNVHPGDNDAQHIQIHMAAQTATGDPTGSIRDHIKLHQQAMQLKNAAQMRQQMPQQAPMPQGGAPQPGAQPQQMRPLRGPPGMIAPESLPAAGAVTMPRKM